MNIGLTAILWPLFAGICLAIVLVHTIVWTRRIHDYANLAMAVVSLSIATLILGEFNLMRAHTPAQFGEIERWLHIPVFIFFIASVLFVHIYLKSGRLWLAWFVCGLRLVSLIINFANPTNLFYDAITGLQPVQLWGGEIVVTAIGVRSRWQLVGQLSTFALIIYFADATFTAWRRRVSAEEGRNAVIIGGSFVLTLVIVLTSSAIMHWSDLAQPFYLFPSYLIVVIANSFVLGRDVIRAGQLSAQLSAANSALHKAQEQVDLISGAAAVGMWEWDSDRDVIWATEQARRLYGFDTDQPINFEKFLSAVHVEDREAVREAALQSLRNDRRFQREYRVQRPDGSVHWIVTRGRVDHSATEPMLLRGISLDISERKFADERFRQVVEAAPNGMLIIDAAGKIVLVNAQIETDFGYSRQELIGQPVEMLMPARFRGEHIGDREQFAAEAQSRAMAVNREVYGRAKDGREISLEVRLNPIRGASGAEVLALVSDISNRRHREELLLQERAFLRQVIDINPNLIFAKDRAGRFTLANHVVADIYGTTVEALIGKTDADFNRDAAEVEWFRKQDAEVLDTLQERVIPEEHLTGADGKAHWLQTVKRPIINKDGSADLVLGTATDITERKQTELDLAQQRNELAHLSRVMMLSELSGSLAHELNQPLAAILSNAQAALRFLERDTPNLHEIRDILRDIVADDKRAGEVIQGLRAMLKKGEPHKEWIDPNVLVLDVVRLLRSDMLNAGVTYATHLVPHLPRIDGIYVQLQQVLLNLMVNACDAMSDVAAAQRRLTVSTANDVDGCVVFSICDQGHGIPVTDVREVFEPFFTTKAHGLGLGLAVCRRLIDAHGGKMWATNNLGVGATFCFSVPAGDRE